MSLLGLHTHAHTPAHSGVLTYMQTHKHTCKASFYTYAKEYRSKFNDVYYINMEYIIYKL